MSQYEYEIDQLDRVRCGGPAADESWFRLQVVGRLETKWLSISEEQLERILGTFGWSEPT